ncbi:MAG: tetraacyldisaccharide 4'-kinase [Francisellaceae bacterium]|jgi:tetraacyldisaccharide 4'-kinase|nr:tetraacyldisaccharide 4'-kinase [Francisellaceae bacterium]MBT6207561.1 tetraacyldisaccharide 4'-kinase [Francisellaceae bacterium]MBT6538929.1 tetraacyldisaccharide 4'-kinase [Francisellaceae bacterium]
MRNYRGALEHLITSYWYFDSYTSLLFSPLSILALLVVKIRRFILISFFQRKEVRPVVIVVGNITVGGTGKTPLVMYIANLFSNRGFKVAIALRGYGSVKPIKTEWISDSDSDDAYLSDEAKLFINNGFIVGIGKNRPAVIEKIEDKHAPDIIICDDGMQHYQLHRNLEICVVDGMRGFGNNQIIPFGPLRESTARLKSVDMIISKDKRFDSAYLMKYKVSRIYSIKYPDYDMLIYPLQNSKVHAVTGIGNPGQFFSMLRSLDIKIIEHVFPDHYNFSENDLMFDDGLPIVMTEKDAVKCIDFGLDNCYVLSIMLEIDEKFSLDLLNKLEVILDDKQKITRNISVPNLQG